MFQHKTYAAVSLLIKFIKKIENISSPLHFYKFHRQNAIKPANMYVGYISTMKNA